MVNRVVLVGRLTKDPELRYSSSNIPMLYFSVAVNRTFTDQNGQRQADFINCVAFRKQAENMARFLGRGSLIGVEGRIQTRNYQGKDGNTVYVTEVVADSFQLLESRNAQGQREGSNSQAPSQNNYGNAGSQTPNFGNGFGDLGSGTAMDISDDDLPF